MYCPKCGSQAQESAAFCVSCGASLRDLIRTPEANTKPSVPPGYVLVPQNRLRELERSAQQGYAAQPTQPRRKYVQPSEKEQVPDPTFTKFIDAPEPPLPFWGGKVALAFVSLGGTGWALFRAWQIGTIELLLKGVTENIPGIPFLMLALLFTLSTACAFASKKSRGASSVSAVCYLFAAGWAFMERETYTTDPMLLVTIAAAIAAVVFLISGAGGVTINLED